MIYTVYKVCGIHLLTKYYGHLHIVNYKTSKLLSLEHHLSHAMTHHMVLHFYQIEWTINPVGQFVKFMKAGIPDKHANYYWGHEEWAEKGVLLLNAALTIPHTKNLGHNMKEHCDKWRPFLVELFDTWIADPQYWQQQQHQQSQAQQLQKQQHQQQQHSKLPMMLWGYKGTYKNFALEVRNKFSYTARDSFFYTLEAHHPNVSGNYRNNFIKEATKLFTGGHTSPGFRNQHSMSSL